MEAYEIYSLDLSQADMVVLSACETQIGLITGGDEVMSLNRAFLQAGALSAMATLWQVDDRSSTELMISFYKNLRSGLNKDGALRKAQ